MLGRRISKERSENGEFLQHSKTEFIWDGSHLVQEIHHGSDTTHSYIYTHPNSYEPLAQLAFAKNNKNPTACYYYHNDQISIPRELTDEQSKRCWVGSYNGWGKLTNEQKMSEKIHQPFRLQNQYCDQETGLHYNFFRYYEPNLGWFDPLGLTIFCKRPLLPLMDIPYISSCWLNPIPYSTSFCLKMSIPFIIPSFFIKGIQRI